MENNFLPSYLLRTLAIFIIGYVGLLAVSQLEHILKAKPQIMQVSGEGKVSAIPDMATVTIGVISEGINAIEVKNINNQRMIQILSFLKKLHIDNQDIQTTEFYSSPKYTYANGTNNITGYQANQSITVKISRIDKSEATLQKILGEVVNNEAIKIQGIDFSFSRTTDVLKDRARKYAIQSAKEKAARLTQDTNLKLGKIINVVTESANNAISPSNVRSGLYSTARTQIQPQIAPGKQDIVENISLLFEVYPK